MWSVGEKTRTGEKKSTEWQSCLSASLSAINPSRTGLGLKERFLPEPCHGTVLCVLASKVTAHFLPSFLSSFLTYLQTYWLHGRVLLDKLTIFQLVKKFPAFYVTQMFITAFTVPADFSQSWASSIQSTTPHSTSRVFFGTFCIFQTELGDVVLTPLSIAGFISGPGDRTFWGVLWLYLCSNCISTQFLPSASLAIYYSSVTPVIRPYTRRTTGVVVKTSVNKIPKFVIFWMWRA